MRNGKEERRTGRKEKERKRRKGRRGKEREDKKTEVKGRKGRVEKWNEREGNGRKRYEECQEREWKEREWKIMENKYQLWPLHHHTTLSLFEKSLRFALLRKRIKAVQIGLVDGVMGDLREIIHKFGKWHVHVHRL